MIHAQPQRADLSLESLEARITVLDKTAPSGLCWRSQNLAFSCVDAGHLVVKSAVLGDLIGLRQQSPSGPARWILDRGFDDAKVISKLLETHACFIIRAGHNRKVRHTPGGKVIKLFEAVQAQSALGTLEMVRPVQEKGKRKKRLLPAVTRSTQVWLSEPFTPLGVVNLQFQAQPNTDPDERGWVLLTNLPLESERDAKHIVALYASRWATLEIFAWTKTALEWEAARVLRFDAFRRLVALAWIAAAFLFELERHLEPRLIEHLAFLGGWTPRANGSPGKRTGPIGRQAPRGAALPKTRRGPIGAVLLKTRTGPIGAALSKTVPLCPRRRF